MKLQVCAVAAAFLWGGLEAAYAAIPVQATASAAENLVIPFAPPLGTDLRYRMTLSRPRGGKLVTTQLLQTLRFTRAEQGYVLTVTPTIGTSAGGFSVNFRKSSPAVPDAVEALMKAQSYDLAGDGSLLRIRDWERGKAELAASVEGMVKLLERDPAKRADARSIAKSVVGAFSEMTAEQAAAHYLKGWSSLLGFGGISLRAGEVNRIESTIEVGFAPEPVPAVTELSLARPDTGTLRYAETTIVDPAKASDALADHVSRMLRGAVVSDPAGQARLEALPKMMRDMQIADRIEIDFDAATGLPRRALVRRDVTLADGSKGGETMKVERLD